MSLSPFHLAIPVYDINAARTFYRDVLNLEEGRSSEQWVDFNFYGHQVVIHEHPKTQSQEHAHTNVVDGHDVPAPHFGVVLPWQQWEALANRLKDLSTKFVIDPCIRFKGETGVSYAEETVQVNLGDFNQTTGGSFLGYTVSARKSFYRQVFQSICLS